ncbi:MAG: hypothetical protein WCK26_02425 [Candidatus Saccharibacteria bacterium]
MSKNIPIHLKESKKDNLIYLFHHIHHESKLHEVHHCGGLHTGVDYEINHCKCGLHSINKQIATGDTIDTKLLMTKVTVKFTEECPDGGWHLESGLII